MQVLHPVYYSKNLEKCSKSKILLDKDTDKKSLDRCKLAG